MTGKRTSSAASNCSTTIKMRAQRQSERASAAAGVTKYASRQRRPARSGKKIASHIQLIVGAVVFRDASRRHLQSSLDRRNTSRNPYRRIPVAEWLGPSFQSTNCNPSTDDGVESILECLHFPGARVLARQPHRVLDEPVNGEPVCDANSLLTGKITGDSSILGHFPARRSQKLLAIQQVMNGFPKKQNRELIRWIWELFSREQGIIIADNPAVLDSGKARPS